MVGLEMVWIVVGGGVNLERAVGEGGGGRGWRGE